MKSNNKTTAVKSGKKFFKKMYKLVDALIVTPISTVVFKIQKRFGKENSLEKLLNRPYALLFISLFFAIIVSLFVHFKMDALTNNDAEFLTNIPVKVVYNSSAYVVEGIPETVNMTLIGKKGELYLARQLGDNEVVVDLTDYQASEKSVEVKLTYNKPIKKLEYQISPEYVTVTIKEKVSAYKTGYSCFSSGGYIDLAVRSMDKRITENNFIDQNMINSISFPTTDYEGADGAEAA